MDLTSPAKLSRMNRILLDVLAKTSRVEQPAGDQVMKVSFAEWQVMKEDPEFQRFETYVNSLLFYVDEFGRPTKPRKKPVRPLVVNEVGMYRGKAVFVKDAGPGDLGEGKYHQVSAQLIGDTQSEKPVIILTGNGDKL